MSILKEIKFVWGSHCGKGYWGNWCWKLLHDCPNCRNKIPIRKRGWTGKLGMDGFRCKCCGKKVTFDEWKNLPRKVLWTYIG